jgi:hypothetical protein
MHLIKKGGHNSQIDINARICSPQVIEITELLALYVMYLGRKWVRTLLSLVFIYAGYGLGHCSLWSLFMQDMAV